MKVFKKLLDGSYINSFLDYMPNEDEYKIIQKNGNRLSFVFENSSEFYNKIENILKNDAHDRFIVFDIEDENIAKDKFYEIISVKSQEIELRLHNTH